MGISATWRFSQILGAAALLAGCSPSNFSQLWTGRWGPPAAIQAEDAGATINNQWLVLQYIIGQAAIPVDTTRATDPNWYLVAQWGFNIGRQDCSVYMAELFRLARERARNNGLLLDASGAATAIVTAVSPHAQALSIIAPAFGLAGNVNDKVLNTYLFSDAPGIIAQKVKDVQDKYAQTVADGRAQINNSAAAYSTIEGFYSLCLPQSIEGILLEKIAGAPAVAAPTGGPKAGSVATPQMLGAAAPRGGGSNVGIGSIRPRISLQ